MFWIKLATIVLFLCLTAPSYAVTPEALTQQMTVPQLVGQIIMVGIPADVNTYTSNSLLREAIRELHVGGFVLNNYNVLNDKDKWARSINTLTFTNYIQRLAFENSPHVPVFIGADFESIRYSSVRSVLEHPPSFLTLASTQDANILEFAGVLAGKQLLGIGVNLIFGPVLDVDFSTSGHMNPNIMTRSFGENESIVSTLAVPYLIGLKKSGILSSAKHFPDVGRSSGNVHNMEMPTYLGGEKELSKQVEVYNKLQKYFDGVMTSHQYLSLLSNEKKRPVTFSSTIVHDLLKGNKMVMLNNECKMSGAALDSKLIITDDLSEMNPITSYREKYRLSYADVAIAAYEAGHDILMFSHVNMPGKNHFYFKHLREVTNGLTTYFQNNENKIKELRRRVAKIIKYKQQLNKKFGFNDQFQMWTFSSAFNVKRFLATNNKHENYSIELKETLKKGTLLLRQCGANYVIKDTVIDNEIDIYVPEQAFSLFLNEFKGHSNFSIISMPRNKKKKINGQPVFNQLKYKIKKSLQQASKVILVISNIDEANLADVLIYEQNNAKNKLILFLHENPKILSMQALQHATVLGNFSNLNEAYQVDIETLNGKLVPKSYKGNLTISLPPYYDVNNFDFPLKNSKNKKVIIFETSREERLHKKYTNLKALVGEKAKEFEKKDFHKTLIIMGGCFLILIGCLCKYIMFCKHNQLTCYRVNTMLSFFSIPRNLFLLICLIGYVPLISWSITGDCFAFIEAWCWLIKQKNKFWF